MVKKKISSIVWRQIAPHEIELVYPDGTSEHVEGSHAAAGQMAEAAGLGLTASPLGTVRWAEERSKPSARSPKRIGPWLSQ